MRDGTILYTDRNSFVRKSIEIDKGVLYNKRKTEHTKNTCGGRNYD